MRMRFHIGTMGRSFVWVVACLLAGPPALGVPGDSVAVINVPVPSPAGVGIGIAVDCETPPTLFYTNTGSAFLHKMNAAGVDLGSVPITNSATGGPISFGAIAWDDTRKVLWGGTDLSGSPLSVYQINPVTGVATFQFTAMTGGFGFTDGITFDPSDDSIYVSDDVSTVIDQHSASTGAHIRSLTPMDAAGAPLGSISGVLVGKGDLLYLGRDGLGEITQVRKSDGGFIATFATLGGRDEDLECDVVSFAPLTVVWSKDAFNDTVEAIEVEASTCECGGGRVDIPTVSEWGIVVMMLLLLVGAKIYFGRQRAVGA